MGNPTLAINFIGNINPLLKSLSQANGGLAGFEVAVKGGGSSLGGLAAGAGLTALAMKGLDGAVGLVQSGIGLLAGAMSKGIGLAAEAEQAQISFEVMLGSASKAKDMLGQIRQFAAATPFESPELIKASKSLLAMGINAKEVVPTLRMLGDVASGTGIPIENMAVMYGKMSAGGRVMNDDLRQLAENGVPVFAMLSKAMGVPTTSLRKMAEQGKISFSHLRNAFIDLTGEGGKFAGMTQRQSQSLAGLWSTLKDNVGLALMGIGQKTTDAFQLKEATAALAANVDTWQSMLGAFAQNAADSLAPLAGVSGTYGEVFASLAKAAVPAFALMADSIQTSVFALLQFKAVALGMNGMMQKATITGDDEHSQFLRRAIDLGTERKEQENNTAMAAMLAQGGAGANLTKAINDLLDKDVDKAAPKPPAGLPKMAAGAQLSPLDKLKGLFPMTALLAGLPGAMDGVKLPGAKVLNDRLNQAFPAEYKSMQAAAKGSADESSILNKARFQFQNKDQTKVEEKMLDKLARIFTDVHDAVQKFKKPAVLDVI